MFLALKTTAGKARNAISRPTEKPIVHPVDCHTTRVNYKGGEMKSNVSFADTYTKFIIHLYNKVPVKPVPNAVGAEIWLVQNLFAGFVRS